MSASATQGGHNYYRFKLVMHLFLTQCNCSTDGSSASNPQYHYQHDCNQYVFNNLISTEIRHMRKTTQSWSQCKLTPVNTATSLSDVTDRCWHGTISRFHQSSPSVHRQRCTVTSLTANTTQTDTSALHQLLAAFPHYKTPYIPASFTQQCEKSGKIIHMQRRC